MMPGARPAPVAVLAAAAKVRRDQSGLPDEIARLAQAWAWATFQDARLSAWQDACPDLTNDPHGAPCLTGTTITGGGLSICINDRGQLQALRVEDAPETITCPLPAHLRPAINHPI